jgi:hypothetical protein
MRDVQLLDSAKYDALYGIKIDSALKERIGNLQRIHKIKMSEEIRKAVQAVVTELETFIRSKD